MTLVQKLLAQNRLWAQEQIKKERDVFHRLSQQQTPRYLWIGCSDSRVPPNQILGLGIGEIFVHRNIANLVVDTDMNLLAVLHYGVEHLFIKDIIVCGHYGCGGVLAAMEQGAGSNPLQRWLAPLRTLYHEEKETLQTIADPADRWKSFVERSVLRQVKNLSHTTIVQQAWARQQKLTIHGLVYDLSNGYLTDLQCCMEASNR